MSAGPDNAPSLPFQDARSCKEWLNALPLGNIPQAQALVLDGLRGLEAADFAPLERLKALELMRDKIAFLQGEQRSRYFGKSLPLATTDTAAWTTGCALLAQMEQGYRTCLERAGAELAPHRALMMQRAARYLGAQMLFHATVYRRFDPALWTRLHALYREAEGAGIATETLKDSLEGPDGTSSLAEAYATAVLMQACYLSEMTAHQMEFAEGLLRLWVRKVPVLRAADATAYALAVDLDKPIGARPLAPQGARGDVRAFDLEALSRSMRKRIHGLANDEDPTTMGLPHVPGVDPASQLQRLHRLWCEGAPPRPPAKLSDVKNVGIVLGLPEIHFFVSGGKVFEQPDRKRELTRQEKQDLEVFGRVTERTASRMVAEHNYLVEAWPVVDEMRGAWRVERPRTSAKSITIGRLVAIRLGDAGAFFLGMVSALSQETDGRIVATITLFPGRPEPVPVRAADARNRANAKWSEGFRLPPLEKAQIAGSLVVPSGVGSRGRGVEVWQDGPKESTVYEVLERGTDFDRITVF
ncbi:MAG TPA: hypothetical protein VFE23_13375 [Usitatibacter sp.]|jgi:hypothetical protein|nr:hypothetical protein [Usitatibacter sp.]